MAYEQESPLINGTSNNTLALSDPLTSGVKMVAALSSASDVDHFRINTTAASLISLDFLSPVLTTASHWQVRLLDAQGDYLRTLASSVPGSPRVNGASQSGTSLVVDGLSSVPPAGSRFTFDTNAADTSVYRVVSATNLAGGASTLTLDRSLPAGLADDTRLVFDPAQLLTGMSASLTAVAPAAGAYTVQVLSEGAVWNGADYALTATVTPTVEKEGTGGNNTREGAADSGNRLLANAAMTGALSGATDVDYWVFTTAKPSDFTVSFASSSTATSPEWKIEVTPWSGAPLSGGSLTAGSSASVSVPSTSFPTAQTFLVAVTPYSSTAFNTGSYTLRVSGSGLDLNDAPVLTVGTVSVRNPEPGTAVDTGVVRSISAGNTTGVRLDSFFSVVDPDTATSGQSVSFYRLSLTKADGVTSDAGIRVGTGNDAKTYGFAATGMQAPGNVVLTAAEMATAVFLPGTTAANTALRLALQAYDSTSTLSALGGADGSGASAILTQTLRVVDGQVGVGVTTAGTRFTLSENTRGEGVNKPNGSSFTVVLNQEPTHDVKVFLNDANDQLDLSAAVLTFTPANYRSAQTVTVTATADSRNEGATQSAPLTFQVVTQDASYDGFLISPLSFTVSDNVAPALAAPAALTYTDTPEEDLFSAPTAGSASGTLSATDANADTLSYGILGGTDGVSTVSKAVALGTLTVTKATGAYVFTPDPDGLNAAAGNASADFTVTVSDGQTVSSRTLTVNVAGVNDAPEIDVEMPQGFVVERGGAGNAVEGVPSAVAEVFLYDAEGSASLDAAGLLALGWATSNNGVTYTKVGNFGTATLNTGTLQLSYALNDNEVKTQALGEGDRDADRFVLQVRDAQGLTGQVAALFRVEGRNDWPVLSPLVDRIATPGQVFSLGLENSLSDPDSDPAVSVTLADGSALPAWLSFNPLTLSLSGTPADADLGVLSVLVTVTDKVTTNQDVTVYDSFDLLVAAASESAVLLADTGTGTEDGAALIGNVLSNDRPSTGNALSVVSYGVAGESPADAGVSLNLPGKGVLRINADGSYTFTPEAQFSGVLPVITYTTNEEVSSTLTLTVQAVDDPSVVTPDAKTVNEDSTATGNVLTNDSDIDSSLAVATFRISGDATVYTAGQTATVSGQGALRLNADGSYVFTPVANFSGAVAAVSYTLNTGAGSSLALTFSPLNDSPTGAVQISGTARQGQVLTASHTLADGDGMGAISYVWKADGQAIANATGSTFKLGRAQIDKAITVEARYIDLAGTAESVTSSPTVKVAADPNAPAGRNIEVQAYAWKSHALLNDVAVSVDQQTVSTSGQGKTQFSDLVDPVSLGASRAAADASTAVNLQDAIGILKLVVGLPVNTGGQALSPYQAYAADYNGNGSVELSDAIDVLKFVVGLPGTPPSWRFVNETLDLSSVAAQAARPGAVPALALPPDTGEALTRVGLVGVLRGDVDGSYTGGANAPKLGTDYFTALIQANDLDASQFGIYPG